MFIEKEILTGILEKDLKSCRWKRFYNGKTQRERESIRPYELVQSAYKENVEIIAEAAAEKKDRGLRFLGIGLWLLKFGLSLLLVPVFLALSFLAVLYVMFMILVGVILTPTLILQFIFRLIPASAVPGIMMVPVFLGIMMIPALWSIMFAIISKFILLSPILLTIVYFTPIFLCIVSFYTVACERCDCPDFLLLISFLLVGCLEQKHLSSLVVWVLSPRIRGSILYPDLASYQENQTFP